MSRLPLLEARATSGAVDADLIAVFQDSGKKAVPPRGAYAALVERFRKSEAFAAKAGAVQFVRFSSKGHAENVLFVGFGAASDATEEKARVAGGNAFAKLGAERVRTVAIHVDSMQDAKGLKGVSPGRLLRAFAEGLMMSAYTFDKHKGRGTEKKSDDYAGPEKLIFVTDDKALKRSLDADFAQVTAVAESMNITRDWSNEPSNHGTPEYYAAEAQRLGRQLGLKVKVLKEADATREKMGLFIAVGQGSEREGRIVVLDYNPKGAAKSKKTIALVGKGVTFDSGGISIKPSMRMEDMKHDMTGAATIMGAIALCARWRVPNRVIAILAFTENMPSGNAVQPGNIITARNGKTVEIINTDAEGRLVLADVLDYACDLKPDAIVDAATLTGAVSVALGKQCCAVLGNDDTLIEAIRRAGDAHGERTWQLPLWDEYFEDMKSDHADMKNACNDGNGGTIRGAIFMKQFIRKGVPWAHLDIAAMAAGLSHISYLPKRGATGLYVRTLAQFAQDF